MGNRLEGGGGILSRHKFLSGIMHIFQIIRLFLSKSYKGSTFDSPGKAGGGGGRRKARRILCETSVVGGVSPRMWKGMKKGGGGMPVKLIPNCSALRVKEEKIDWLFGAPFGGISKQVETDSIKVRNWTNGEANKFLIRRFQELERHRDSGRHEEYWRSAWRVMESEASIPSGCCFNYYVMGDTRNLVWRKVRSILEKTRKLIKERSKRSISKGYIFPKPTERRDH